MLKGVTKTGFQYAVEDQRLNNYELLEYIGELEENPLILSKVVNLLLGKEQTKKLKEHVRTKEGMVPAEKMSDEITQIFENQKVKNSQSSLV